MILASLTTEQIYRQWTEAQIRVDRLDRERSEARGLAEELRRRLAERLHRAGFSGENTAMALGTVALSLVGSEIRVIVLGPDPDLAFMPAQELAGPGHPAENASDPADPGAGARD